MEKTLIQGGEETPPVVGRGKKQSLVQERAQSVALFASSEDEVAARAADDYELEWELELQLKLELVTAREKGQATVKDSGDRGM